MFVRVVLLHGLDLLSLCHTRPSEFVCHPSPCPPILSLAPSLSLAHALLLACSPPHLSLILFPPSSLSAHTVCLDGSLKSGQGEGEGEKLKDLACFKDLACAPPSSPSTTCSWWDVSSRGDGGGEGGGIAVVCIGGGHYAPKHGDLVRKLSRSRVFLGHILPSYTMDFSGEASEWQSCLREAVEATTRGFAPAVPEIVCHIDKKAFKATDREALIRFIEVDLGLRTALKASEVVAQVPPHASR